MVRTRELLSLTDIADETGISYATLRNYAVKYSAEIPSEGFGRSTRYPRAAVKVFQRLRRESKPGRKPASARVIEEAPAPVTASVRPLVGQVVPLQAPVPAPLPPPRQQEVDLSGIERELAGIRAYLGSIAKSLEQLASEPRTVAPAPVVAAPAPVAEERPAAPAPEAPPDPTRVPLRELTDRPEQPIGGHRRLHSLPKVMGQRGKRPD